jgi:hypothetical protein
MTAILTLSRDNKDIEVLVTYTYDKGSKGCRDSLGGVRGAGPPLEPDEPPSIEIESVENLETGELLEFSSSDEASILPVLWDLLADDNL